MSEIVDFSELKASNVLPSPEGIRLKVMRMCQNEQLSLSELAKMIQTDPVMTGRIIRVANAMNPSRTRAIASVTTCVLILVGIQAVRQIVLGISLVTSYQNGGCNGFDYARFWSRSGAMACAAQTLAGCIRIAPAAEMFTCGLLAGIGRLGLASARPNAYSRLLEQHQGQPTAGMTRAETQLFGLNHLSLAAAMMSDWKIPRLFSDAVLLLDEAPQACDFESETRQQRLARILQLAACIADICVVSDEERERLIPALFAFGITVGIEPEQLAAVVSQTSSEWVEWGEVLHVQTRSLPALLLPNESATQ